MTLSTIRKLLLACLLVVVSASRLEAHPAQAPAKDKGPVVLVLNSYHPQYLWTERLVDGIRAGLSETVLDENLHIEYMDGRRFAGDTSYTDLLLPLYRTKYTRYPPDVIVSTDDIALGFLVQHGDELFPGIPVVFCGVNDFNPETLEGKDNFTGILEGTEVQGNIDLILQVHPNTKQIVFLSDRTHIGTLISQEARTIMAQRSSASTPPVELTLWNHFSHSELLQRLGDADPDTVFLMLAIHQDRGGRYFSYADDLRTLSEASTVPIYGMWGAILLGRGALGGMMNDPDTHGKDAVALVLRILAGEQAANIPIVPKARYEPAFDYKQMKRFGVSLDQIPAGSSVLDRPVPILSAIHPAVVWAMAAVIAALSIGILFLLDHRRQLRKVHTSTQLLESIVNSTADAIIGIGKNDKVVSWNSAAETMSGFAAPEMVGESMLNVIESSAPPTREATNSSWREGKVIKATAKLKHKDGKLVDVALTSSPLLDPEGEVVGASIVARDITEDLQAQRDLDKATRRAHEAEKLASTATLTAGIAHDIGAPLTAILGYAELMEISLTGDEKNRRRAGIIVEQLNRITELVQALLGMSRPDESVRTPVNVASVIDKSLDFYQEVFRKQGIQVHRSDSQVPTITGDANRLQQVFLNLFVNAADAMREGGELSVHLGEPCKSVVEICIQDSGAGITPDQIERIFEPFYTTKERGRGTGLGLLVAKSIIDDHGGSIVVESPPSRGTTFTIQLPASETGIA